MCGERYYNVLIVTEVGNGRPTVVRDGLNEAER